jgi:hypothetical protein
MALLDALEEQQGLILALLGIYTLSIIIGMLLRTLIPGRALARLGENEANQNQQLEKVFGRYRQSLRDGELRTIVICTGLVFAFNLLADLVQFTLLGILIIPVAFVFVIGAALQGISLRGMKASTPVSLILYLLVVTPEWLTYVIATAAGVNIGLSLVTPERQMATSHWQGFLLGLGDALHLYAVIIPILAVQAVAEVLYVRKVLLSGGSGVPLQPY